jgi:hypothetical protein
MCGTTPPPPPTIELFNSDAIVVEISKPVTFQWDIDNNVNSLILDGNAIPVSATGVYELNAEGVTGSKTYTLEATGDGGTVSKTLTINTVGVDSCP